MPDIKPNAIINGVYVYYFASFAKCCKGRGGNGDIAPRIAITRNNKTQRTNYILTLYGCLWFLTPVLVRF